MDSENKIAVIIRITANLKNLVVLMSMAPGEFSHAEGVVWSLDIWKTEIVLRRSKIFIATGIQIAISSVGAAYYGQHLCKTNRSIIDARALAKNTSSC